MTNQPDTPAQRFRAWRRRMGWTVERAGAELGKSVRTICGYEAGEFAIPKAIELACAHLETLAAGIAG